MCLRGSLVLRGRGCHFITMENGARAVFVGGGRRVSVTADDACSIFSTKGRRPSKTSRREQRDFSEIDTSDLRSHRLNFGPRLWCRQRCGCAGHLKHPARRAFAQVLEPEETDEVLCKVGAGTLKLLLRNYPDELVLFLCVKLYRRERQWRTQMGPATLDAFCFGARTSSSVVPHWRKPRRRNMLRPVG